VLQIVFYCCTIGGEFQFVFLHMDGKMKAENKEMYTFKTIFQSDSLEALPNDMGTSFFKHQNVLSSTIQV